MLSDFSVRKPYTVVVAVILVLIMGVVSLMNMTTDLFPSINLPYSVIVTAYPGASPEQVEMILTRPVEQRMASISNIKNVSSISRENMSLVILEFNESANMDSVVIEMRESLDLIKSYMPDGVGNPMIMKLNPDMMPIMVLTAAVEDMDIAESSVFLEELIVSEIESIEGIASVSVSGLVENQIHVILDRSRIDAINDNIKAVMMAAMANMPEIGEDDGKPQIPEIVINSDMISGILKGQNFSMPAGYINEKGTDYLVRVGDKIESIEQIKELKIMELPFPGMNEITIGDVADVIFMDTSGKSYSKVNGSDAITVTIQKQTDYPTSGIAGEIRAKMDKLMEDNEGLSIFALMDQGEYIDIVVKSISMNLIFGGLLAILILLLFLRDLKPTLIVSFAIPISLITAFVMMYFAGITLNIISMGGLALGVGMLVDNSIVVIENIYRMRNEGRSSKDAAIEGAKQVSGAIVASTLTTIAVFLPIVFTQGLTRQIFTDMGLTIAFSLLASLLIALTLVPMMAAGMLKKNTVKDHKIFDKIKDLYANALGFTLKRKSIVILLAIILLVFSITGALRLGTALFPDSDTGQLSVNLQLSKGTAFEDLVQTSDHVMNEILGIEDVKTVGTASGGGMMSIGSALTGSSDSVNFYVRLSGDRKRSTDEIAQIIRDRIESDEYEASVTNAGMDISALSGSAIAVEIRGSNFDTLNVIAADVGRIISEVEGTIDVSDGIENSSEELRISVDKNKSIVKGITTAQVFMEISKAVALSSPETSIQMGRYEYDVYVREDKPEIDRNSLMNINIQGSGESIRLGDIATVNEAEGFSSISRVNQQRYVTVSASLAQGYNVGIVSEQINEKLNGYELPDGYSLMMAGESSLINESFSDLFLMLLLAVIFIYLIMVAQFQSLLSPFIVMFTIPLAFTGGFLGLMVSGKPISTVAFIGLIVLSGVVVNNGIVFVDYINKLREEGTGKKEAIIKAGRDRMRPIVMTALTTIFALSLMSFGSGEGMEMMQPMAITAIGGLIYSTILTLFLVPVLYDGFNRK